MWFKCNHVQCVCLSLAPRNKLLLAVLVMACQCNSKKKKNVQSLKPVTNKFVRVTPIFLIYLLSLFT